MKVLIVYDTLHGNTEKIAKALKEGIASKHEVKLIKAAESKISDIKNIEMLMLGSPTHGGWYTEPIKNFLGAIPEKGLQNIKAAAFDTGSTKENQNIFVKALIGFFGYASPRIAKVLNKKEANNIGSETFFVLDMKGPLKDGEIERAKEWARRIIS